MHEVLVNRLGGLSLPMKSVVRLTDRPDMTLHVYREHKTTMQQCNRKSKLLKNALSAIYLLKGLMDFNQTCTDMSLGDAKDIRLYVGDLDPIFHVTGGPKKLEKKFSVFTFSSE